MAYPADTAVETAIASIEAVLVEDLQISGSRDKIELWRELLAHIETLGATGYDALTQRDWSLDKLNGS